MGTDLNLNKSPGFTLAGLGSQAEDHKLCFLPNNFWTPSVQVSAVPGPSALMSLLGSVRCCQNVPAIPRSYVSTSPMCLHHFWVVQMCQGQCLHLEVVWEHQGEHTFITFRWHWVCPMPFRSSSTQVSSGIFLAQGTSLGFCSGAVWFANPKPNQPFLVCPYP